MDESSETLEMIAMLNFGVTFAEYVKEVDPEMWNRARDFAIDYCTKVRGVEMKLVNGEDKE